MAIKLLERGPDKITVNVERELRSHISFCRASLCCTAEIMLLTKPGVLYLLLGHQCRADTIIHLHDLFSRCGQLFGVHINLCNA